MKKYLFIITSVLLISSKTYSQYALDKGQSQVNVGLGISSWGVPIYAGIDYGVHRYFSIGGEASFRSYIDGFGDRQNTLGVLANGNFHFGGLLQIPKKWDIYMGVNAGFFYISSPTNGISAYGSSGVGAQAGARYYFQNNMAVNFELGGGTIFDWGKIGITYIFK